MRCFSPASIITGTWVASQSCSSCLVNWKYQFIFPLSALSASSELLYKLSPDRPSPRFDGEGFPVGQKIWFVAGSYVPVFHAGAPPTFHESPSQVSCPGSPGPGTV